MTNTDYEIAIATLISNFRYSELGFHLDSAHVHRWISQFDETDRYIILQETLHVLSRSYYKKDRLESFYNRVLKYLNIWDTWNNVSFIDNQAKGQSQKQMMTELQRIAKEIYHIDLHITQSVDNTKGICIYIDDGLYTGCTIRDDLIKFLNTARDKEIHIFLVVSYSNNKNFVENELQKIAIAGNNSIDFHVEKKLNNIKNVLQNYDTVWPHKSLLDIDRVRQYGNQIAAGRRTTYICHDDSYTSNLFSFPEHDNVMSRAFLLKGLNIVDSINGGTSFRPLGYDTNVSFGFGSFFATDINISNTCPLVLWWGSIDEKDNPALGNWYPLLPRRGNAAFFEKILVEEEKHNLEDYFEVFISTHRLAIARSLKEKSMSWEEELSTFSLERLYKKRDEDELLSYLYSLNFDQIKMILTLMYIGRDLRIEPNDEYYQQLENYDGDGVLAEWNPYPVHNPNTLVKLWLAEFEETFGTNKSHWVEQIQQKSPLGQYLKQAFQKLGILHGHY